jgi:hypothetical protein
MSLITIPSMVETNVAGYLQEVSSVSYPVYAAFGVAEFATPCVLVKSGKYTQMEPGTHVYEGRFAVSVITQIDEVEDPTDAHDAQVAAVYEAMEDAALFTDFDTNGTLWKIWVDGIEQEKQDRSLITILEFNCFCQNLTLPVPAEE